MLPESKEAAPGSPGDLERKASTAAPAEVGLLGADDATGVVEAIVSVTGVVDEVKDIIEPGAYKATLLRRRPKGIFSHDWGRWASRTEQVEELMPRDPRLPAQTKDGKPWPAEAGGLYVKTRYNLATDEGRNAYHNVKFFSESGECEWSIGYRVPAGKSTRGKDGIRRIKELDLFEYSPVLFGAAPLSGTLSVKQTAAGGTDDGEGADGDVVTELSDDDETPEEVAGILGVDLADDDPGESGDGDPEGGEPDPADPPDVEPGAGEETAPPQDPPTGEDPPADPAGDDPDPDPHLKLLADMAHLMGRDDLASQVWADLPGVKAAGHISLDRSPKKNWVEATGQLPAYIQHIANALHTEKGVPLSRAIPMAIATVKRWAAGGDDVKPDTKTKAAKALAEWEALKAKAAAKRGEKTAGPAVEVTFEELQAQLADAAVKALCGDGAHLIEVVGTWPDRVIVARYPAGQKSTLQDAYEIPYSVNAGGEVKLGVPEPVALTVTVHGDEEGAKSEPGEGLVPFPGMLDQVSAGLKAFLLCAEENKAGRVLSSANERRLKAAVQQLVGVLQAAGVDVSLGDEEPVRTVPTVTADSTAPSARTDEKTVVDPALIARGFRVVADAVARRA